VKESARSAIESRRNAESFEILAASSQAGALEFLIGASLPHHDPGSLESRDQPMSAKLKLKKQPEGKGLKYGPVRFRSDGTISVAERRLTLSAIPEGGLNIEDITLLRSGADLMAVNYQGKLMVFAFAHGCWYHGDPVQG
jgi:hypothetical protein